MLVNATPAVRPWVDRADSRARARGVSGAKSFQTST